MLCFYVHKTYELDDDDDDDDLVVTLRQETQLPQRHRALASTARRNGRHEKLLLAKTYRMSVDFGYFFSRKTAQCSQSYGHFYYPYQFSSRTLG